MIDPKIFTTLKDYAGDDRVISSFEMRDWLEMQPELKIIRFGFPRVDRLCEGFEAGELVVISGPRKNGKSLWAQSITYHLNEQEVYPLWFSYEVTPKNFFKRFDVKGLPFFALPFREMDNNLGWIEERIVEALVKFGSAVVFIDHLHYLLDLERIRNPSLEIGTLIRKLKRICVNYNIIIVLMCHFTKHIRGDEPDTGDARDSSFIEQESDTGFVIWRDKTDKKKESSWLKLCYARRSGAFDEKIKLRKENGVLVESDDFHKEPAKDGKLAAAGEPF